MTFRTTIPALAACCTLGLGLAAVRAEDKPGHGMAGHDMGKMDQPGHDMSKMSHDEMMEDCHEHAMACQKHLDEATTSANANNMEETKKHLALAKDEMDKCMKMMMAMDKKDGGSTTKPAM